MPPMTPQWNVPSIALHPCRCLTILTCSRRISGNSTFFSDPKTEMSYSNLPIRRFLLHRPQFFAASIAVVVLLCAFVNGASAAGLAIEIIGGGVNQIPITVVPFAGEDRFTQRMSQ